MPAGWSYGSLCIWTALDDATRENGCLEFIPGSHLGRVLAHHSVKHDDDIPALETTEIDPAASVPCPVRAGQAVAHDQRTLHFASANATSHPRRAYILVFRTVHASVTVDNR
jgi:ectoine hydroxylase-related dioxygenase (phytanoyl-CoA dioxygenase family)